MELEIRIIVTSRVSQRRLAGKGMRELYRVRVMLYVMIVMLVAGMCSFLGLTNGRWRSVHFIVCHSWSDGP